MKVSRKKKIILFSILFLLLFASGAYFLYATRPTLDLNGEETITININGEYEELGANAFYFGKNLAKDITIENNIDVQNKGTYFVQYQLKKGIYNIKKRRTVLVKDIEAPSLTLKGENTAYLCPNQVYEEEGYTAFDNVDGDITSSVQRIEEETKIIYTIEDKEGNKNELERNLVFTDTEKPKIELIGGTYTMYVNDTYKEPGYKVTDNCDTAIESKVKITSTLNPYQVGTYEITYEVTDASSNVQSAKRVVNVIQRPQGGVIYLTFDDGPNVGTTDVILDILKEEGVKATFFVTGNGPDYLIKRESDEGHAIALHTATHNYAKVYASIDAYFNDLKIIHDRVLQITGKDVKIIRFPGGSSNTVSRNYCIGIMSQLVKEVVNRGYRYFDWNVDSDDAGSAFNSWTVYNNVVTHLSSTRVNLVLMHDVKPQTRDALRDIIRYAKANGFTFATITPTTPMVVHGVNN